MNVRSHHVISRLRSSGLVVVAASAVALAACNGSASSAPEASATNATASAETSAATTTQRGPGHFLFKQVQALDLRAEQQASVAEIQENLRADMEPHREVVRQVARGIADAIEVGHLDEELAKSNQAALSASLADAKSAFATAMNSVHDTLDAGQRAELVERLRALHEGRASAGETEHQGPLAKLALEIGLTPEQRASIKDAFQRGADELFPSRKERRLAHEAQLKAMADAFVSEDFDAQNFEMWDGAEHGIEVFTEIASRGIEVSESLLNGTQRQALAETLREHANKI